jgi:hypothetical protein
VSEFAMTPAERKKLFRPSTKKSGYAHIPGSGPEGETCGSCKHKVRRSDSSVRSFLKCGLRKASWTNGTGTDILARSPACKFWERP